MSHVRRYLEEPRKRGGGKLKLAVRLHVLSIALARGLVLGSSVLSRGWCSAKKNVAAPPERKGERNIDVREAMMKENH